MWWSLGQPGISVAPVGAVNFVSTIVLRLTPQATFRGCSAANRPQIYRYQHSADASWRCGGMNPRGELGGVQAHEYSDRNV